MKISIQDVLAHGRVCSYRNKLFEVALQDDKRKWKAIRKIYETVDFSRYTAYPVDWTLLFSPIESIAWGDIRGYGLPFYPQLPIGRYFADFADPIKKIVIECDGKRFHNKHRDDLRDVFMGSNGWDVFRISGADCNRIVDCPWEEILSADYELSESEIRQIIGKWASKTVEGLVWAISLVYYSKSEVSLYKSIACDVLSDRGGAFYA